MQVILTISMVFNALFIVLLYVVNNTWYKYTNKINEKWHEIYEEINTGWQETFKEVRKNLREIKDISSSTIILDKVKEILGNKNEKKSKKKI